MSQCVLQCVLQCGAVYNSVLQCVLQHVGTTFCVNSANDWIPGMRDIIDSVGVFFGHDFGVATAHGIYMDSYNIFSTYGFILQRI